MISKVKVLRLANVEILFQIDDKVEVKFKEVEVEKSRRQRSIQRSRHWCPNILKVTVGRPSARPAAVGMRRRSGEDGGDNGGVVVV